MEILASPWFTVGLVSYVLIARFAGWPTRWIGVGALSLLVGTAVAVTFNLEGLAEQTAQASYFWFVAFTVGLVLDEIRPGQQPRVSASRSKRATRA